MRPWVIGIGELLWDLLPAGPEMGGAPANFACHAGAMGANAGVISAVGGDPSGAALLRKLGDLGIRTDGIAVHPDLPTGSVGVELDEEGQPSYTIHPDTAWDHLPAGPRQFELVAKADAICFGTLAQRSVASMEAIRSLVAAAGPEVLRVLDVNLRPPFYSAAGVLASLDLANVLKLNEGELMEVGSFLGFASKDGREICDALMAKYDLRLIACTRGSRGAVLYNGQEWAEHPGFPVETSDTVGAGDSFAAAVVMGFLKGWPLAEIAAAANEAAAHVCSRPGAIPALPEAMRNRFAGGRRVSAAFR